MKTHELKTWPTYFQAALDENKRFECRRYDRDFSVGDKLLLREWDNYSYEYTGRELLCEITYKLSGVQFGIAEGWCVLSISVEVMLKKGK